MITEVHGLEPHCDQDYADGKVEFVQGIDKVWDEKPTPLVDRQTG